MGMAGRGERGMALRRERAVEFSQPVRQIVLMVAVLVAVAVIGWFLYAPIEVVFRANVYLNGLIVGVFLIGVVACFRAVAQVLASVSWIEGFAADRAGHEFADPPRLMASLSALLRDKGSRAALSATSTRSILDSVATRLDEARDITRYLGSLLIFLGLLGTFWGLSNTVPAVVDTIRSLAPDAEGGAAGVFDNLMSGLEDQLGGMGTAFASSLLGLAGSMVIGLLELFAGHAQNRFFRELEDWLASITRIGGVSEGGDGASSVALVAENAAQIERLVAVAAQGDEKREAFEARVAALTDSVSRLAGALATQEGAAAKALERVATQLERRYGEDGEGEDLEARARLRSIDRQLMRLTDELAAGRQDAVSDIRAELHGLTRAIQTLAGRER
ncbi:hypothetical protein SAMN05444370_104260 [Rubrimonas cliftonensis]|uniref:Biopolymer transporter ExbB n=2 Tax=Rubrimonas cliftonensis TaxID=89524 RepID=A0A1H4AJT2_9RHOB|nr:hypothetical protein SAMN05444370_104260 [Rubrimonas cliftonensis]